MIITITKQEHIRLRNDTSGKIMWRMTPTEDGRVAKIGDVELMVEKS